jgi:hypothetical protein
VSHLNPSVTHPSRGPGRPADGSTEALWNCLSCATRVAMAAILVVWAVMWMASTLMVAAWEDGKGLTLPEEPSAPIPREVSRGRGPSLARQPGLTRPAVGRRGRRGGQRTSNEKPVRPGPVRVSVPEARLHGGRNQELNGYAARPNSSRGREVSRDSLRDITGNPFRSSPDGREAGGRDGGTTLGRARRGPRR